ncbi:MAG: hypothetical protein ACXQS5_02775 [Candidatus Methanospirareceae archaeon]
MIKEFKIIDELDVRGMENTVNEMRELLEKLSYGEMSNENDYTLSDLKNFCVSLIDGQRNDINGLKLGSWCLAPSVSGMPSDARVYLVFVPTYIAIAILTRVLLDYPEIPKQISNYEEVLRRGFKFATYRRLRGHGIGAGSEMIEAIEILSYGKVVEYLLSNPDFCPELLQILRDIRKELANALESGAVKGPWGEDYVKAFEFVKNC